MSRVLWDGGTQLVWGDGPHFFDRGVDQGVLYLDGTAVPWNGLVSVEERANGDMDVEHYFDGNRIHIAQVTGDYQARISAYTYPELFSEYNGFSDVDEYRRFGLSYRTEYDDGHKIHLVYNALIRDDNRSWTTIGARPDPSLFNWDIYTSAEDIADASPAAHLIMEAPRDESVLAQIEDILYGSATTAARLPNPDELTELYELATTLRIVYNGDGTYTASGPDSMVRLLDDGRFEIDSPSVYSRDRDTFTVISY